MKSVYVVRAIPVRDIAGGIGGWVCADLCADGSRPTDMIILRDGTSCGQAEGLERINADRSLLYATEEEAVQGGLAQLTEADRKGDLRPANW